MVTAMAVSSLPFIARHIASHLLGSKWGCRSSRCIIEAEERHLQGRASQICCSTFAVIATKLTMCHCQPISANGPCSVIFHTGCPDGRVR
ncbi:hypothetical protein AOLI_G00093660 [Acnodon oligacanthus]